MIVLGASLANTPAYVVETQSSRWRTLCQLGGFNNCKRPDIIPTNGNEKVKVKVTLVQAVRPIAGVEV